MVNVIKVIRQKILRLLNLYYSLTALENKIDDLKILVAKNIIKQIQSEGIYDNIQKAEFKVFSQVDDDGIIQYLINNVDISSHTFIEFGVQNYQEANTKFLLINNNWKGLIIDGSKKNIESVKNKSSYYKYDLTAISAFIDRNNINEIISNSCWDGDLGILSIDIDGNDYWVWESVNVVTPTIVIVEYNSIFGYKHAVTIPYQPDFIRKNAHYSCLYYGASLKALCLLADKKGYVFVGSNSYGNNAYFVKKDKLGSIKPIDVETGYVTSKYRESRDAEGQLSYLSGKERIKAIEHMPVYDIEKEQLIPVGKLIC